MLHEPRGAPAGSVFPQNSGELWFPTCPTTTRCIFVAPRERTDASSDPPTVEVQTHLSAALSRSNDASLATYTGQPPRSTVVPRRRVARRELRALCHRPLVQRVGNSPSMRTTETKLQRQLPNAFCLVRHVPPAPFEQVSPK